MVLVLYRVILTNLAPQMIHGHAQVHAKVVVLDHVRGVVLAAILEVHQEEVDVRLVRMDVLVNVQENALGLALHHVQVIALMRAIEFVRLVEVDAKTLRQDPFLVNNHIEL